MKRRLTRSEVENKVSSEIARIERAELLNKLGREPTADELRKALDAAQKRRRASAERYAAADTLERRRIKAALLTPLGKRISAINSANRKYASGVIANAERGNRTRISVIDEARKLLVTNPRLSKSAAAKIIGGPCDAICGVRQAKDILDHEYTADEWRKLADAVTTPAN